jgi:HD-GYP domain-containing protein (c-di-GMP phosphodiesterase class II)
MPSTTIQREYLPVATATLVTHEVLDWDLFLERPGSGRIELYRGRNYPLTPDDVGHLRSQGIEQLFIRFGDADAYHQYLRDHVLLEASIPPPDRMTALCEATRVSFENALYTSNCDALVAIAADFGRTLADLVSARGVVFGDMFALLEHDFLTFTHVCNVSTYCVLLARELGPADTDVLSEIAAGALLHDIGKRHVPAAILNKPGKPSPEEWEQIRRHPATGYQELARRDDVTWGQLMMIYQHHERLDGTGYPAGVRGGEMHDWAKLCAVADVFDALTCHRPYRKGLPVPEVCAYLVEHAETWFDKDVVACLTSQLRGLA